MEEKTITSPGTLYTTVLTRLKAVEPTASFNVSHYTISLDGSEEDNTHWYVQTFSEGAIIEAILLSKASQQFLTGTGTYVKTDALCLTLTVLAEGDKIQDAKGLRYKVVAVRHHPWGDVTVTYEADLIDITDMEGNI